MSTPSSVEDGLQTQQPPNSDPAPFAIPKSVPRIVSPLNATESSDLPPSYDAVVAAGPSRGDADVDELPSYVECTGSSIGGFSV